MLIHNFLLGILWGKDGSVEEWKGWKGCLCLNRRLQGKEGLFRRDGIEGRMEGWKDGRDGFV